MNVFVSLGCACYVCFSCFLVGCFFVAVVFVDVFLFPWLLCCVFVVIAVCVLQYRVGGVSFFCMLFSWLACWCLFDVGGCSCFANVRCGC